MSITQRIVNVFRSSQRPEPPEPGRLVQPRKEDSWRDYPADGLTPARLAQILRAADEGALDAAMQLYEQMEEKDAHLFSVANTRRLALTGLPWQVVSAADVVEGLDRALADEAADYCREQLTELDGFDEALQHLALAMGRNIAIAELLWQAEGSGHRLAGIVPVDFTRIVFDELDRPRILTEQEPYKGIELPANKFVVHTPHSVSGHPSRGGLLRVSALAFLGKHYAVKDWLVFAEVFGMPVRIARYEPSATPQEKRELLEMLQKLGSDAAGIFSKAVELELVEARGGGGRAPYQAIAEFFNREISKAWLGQTLTTDTAGTTGTFAAARIHEQVRQDLREDDIRKEARTIRQQVLRPVAQFKFGLEVPVPYFRRKMDLPRDLRELADVLAVAVNELGIRVPRRWAHEMLGIPEPTRAEAVLDNRPSGRRASK
ncbi:MAG: DUF935 family protein [Phycisphaerae bacterium]